MTTQIVIALFIGALVGMILVGLLVGAKEVPTHEDTKLLDYLERSECTLLFNTEVGGGSWGLLDAAGNVVAAGVTVRRALTRAREKEAEVVQ